MIESIFGGFMYLADPYYLSMLLLGTAIGMATGILPGLGGSVGISICLPFIIYADPAAAIALLIGLIAVTTTSDTITSVLLSIPGTVGSVATILDGHQMARKGEAARALSAAFIASAFGGIFGAIFLALSIPIVGFLLKQIGSAEFLMLTFLGIAAVSTLSGDKPLRGIIAAGIGMMLAAIGGATLTPFFRYSFDLPYLYDGIHLILLALGIFGLPEIIDLAIRGLPISGSYNVGKGAMNGFKDVLRNIWLVIRCSFIGLYIGFIPGMGTSVASWLGYSHAVQSAKDSESFGKGDVRGVIGPESANNAARGGELIPTLLFGVPGSASMALMLMAMVMFDVLPGPTMITSHLDLTFSIVWSLVVANIVAAVVCIFLAKYLARIATVDINILAPIVLIIIVMGAFQATQDWGDLITLLSLGVLGWIMKHVGYPRPPLVVGFVLGQLAERYLGLTLQVYGVSFVFRPGVILIAVLILVTMFYGMTAQKNKSKGSTAIGGNSDES